MHFSQEGGHKSNFSCLWAAGAYTKQKELLLPSPQRLRSDRFWKHEANTAFLALNPRVINKGVIWKSLRVLNASSVSSRGAFAHCCLCPPQTPRPPPLFQVQAPWAWLREGLPQWSPAYGPAEAIPRAPGSIWMAGSCSHPIHFTWYTKSWRVSVKKPLFARDFPARGWQPVPPVLVAWIRLPSTRAYASIDSRVRTSEWNVHVYCKQCCSLYAEHCIAKSQPQGCLTCVKESGAVAVLWPLQTFRSGPGSLPPALQGPPRRPPAFRVFCLHVFTSSPGFRLQPLCNLLMLSRSREIFCCDNEASFSGDINHASERMLLCGKPYVLRSRVLLLTDPITLVLPFQTSHINKAVATKLGSVSVLCINC